MQSLRKSPKNINELKKLLLQLAVQGKLTEELRIKNNELRMKSLSIKDELSDFLLYTAPGGGNVKVEVILSNETVWLTQKSIAQLFGVQVPAISKHLNNIFENRELEMDATISILETVQQEGSRSVKRQVEFYNLDAIISVGYRVNSTQATQFRIWATNTLKEYIIKGFIMDDERLKNGRYFGSIFITTKISKLRFFLQTT